MVTICQLTLTYSPNENSSGLTSFSLHPPPLNPKPYTQLSIPNHFIKLEPNILPISHVHHVWFAQPNNWKLQNDFLTLRLLSKQ